MSHLLYLMFRCDGDVMESLDFGVVFEGSKHTPCNYALRACLDYGYVFVLFNLWHFFLGQPFNLWHWDLGGRAVQESKAIGN